MFRVEYLLQKMFSLPFIERQFGFCKLYFYICKANKKNIAIVEYFIQFKQNVLAAIVTS
jgi:hypothetical protein